MNTQKNILLAFVLNFAFSIFELIGGLFTGSVAILSDALHDIGDALSIGVSFILEKKSRKAPDDVYTYGYARFSVLGSVVTNLILLFGSVIVIYNAVIRILNPSDINYNGMIIFAVVGVAVNSTAAFFTREKGSINQKAVNLHMLEDVLGWAVVLVGAVVMKFTDFVLIDPLMSMAVACFILFSAWNNLKEAVEIFLDKKPCTTDVKEIREHVCEIEGVIDVHHVHIWTSDGNHIYATMHVVTDGEMSHIKKLIREELCEHGISHVTLELENTAESCGEETCCFKECENEAHPHHHHHHHHGHHH